MPRDSEKGPFIPRSEAWYFDPQSMKRAAMARLHVATPPSSADTESIESRSQSSAVTGGSQTRLEEEEG